MKKIAFAIAVIILTMSFMGLSAFAEGDMVTVTFRTSDGENRFIYPYVYPYDTTNEVVIERKRGYVLTQHDVPFINVDIPDSNVYEWDIEPIGLQVNEDTVITLIITPNNTRYSVIFYDWDGNEALHCDVQYGNGARPPELEDRDGMMAIDWYSPESGGMNHYYAITCDMNFYPVGILRGDANHNDKLDAGDATLVLRRVVERPRPAPGAGNYDFNKNDEVDAGDATGILRAVLGMK